ncbi:MAG: dihydrolipoyllysine-residue acetyltransferase [Burkholderiaceae bacterium]
MAVIEIKVPDIGDFSEVSVIEVLVKPGDTIRAEQSLITVESDKASIEIPSSQSGVVKEILVKLGDKVREGSVVLLLEGTQAGDSLPASPASVPVAQPVISTPTPEPSATAPSVSAPTSTATMVVATPSLPSEAPLTLGQLPHASPSVRKFARELGVPLDEVKGSGPKGRITQEDVQNFTRAVMSGDTQTRASSVQGSSTAGLGGLSLLAWPKVDFAKFGPVQRQDLSRIKKISGANLHRNWVMIPHVTNHDNADITELEALRVKLNQEQSGGQAAKVTMLAFVIKACVAALKKFPEFNASLDGEQLVYKQYYHIGFAADTPNGLVVPVLRDADQKGIAQLSQELSELSKKARDGKLAAADMTGGCFSISSLGGIGGRYFHPIINAPEVAILGISKSVMEPVWNGLEFVPRLMLPLSLSYDHRVIDGATAARFNVYLAQLLADFRRVLL